MIPTLESEGYTPCHHIWHACDGPAEMTPFMKAVREHIRNHSTQGEECIEQIVSIHSADSRGHDCSHCLFTLRLPNGLFADIEYDTDDAQHIFYDLEVIDVEWAADFVYSVFSHIKRRGHERLARDILRETQNMRMKFQEWSDTYGVEIHLLESRLRWTEWERYTGDTPILISVSALGNNLLPERLEFHVDDLKYTDEKLEGVLEDLRRSHEKLKSLRQQGADGTIDLMAIRALSEAGSVEVALRNLAGPHGLGNKQADHFAHISGRHVRICELIDSKPNIRFDGSQIEILGVHLPQTALEAAIGEPVTRIIQHPYLTTKMIVLAAKNCGVSERKVRIQVRQPVYFFCSLTGQIGSELASPIGPLADCPLSSL